MGYKEILKEMAGNGHFITEQWVDELIAAGLGTVPVLVRRSQGREVVPLRDLKAHLAKPLAPHDYVRDVSTWPECVKEVLSGHPSPEVPRKYMV